MQNESQNRVLIIGAGLSGLSAADQILRQNPKCQVTVLEALDRIGGRTITKQINGYQFDLGAQFIGKSQKYVIQLANRANQQFVPELYVGAKVLYLNGKRSTYKSSIPKNVNIIALLQMQFCIWKVNRMAKKVPLLDPKQCEMANYWDSITLQTWVQQNLYSQKVRLLFQCAIRVILGSQLSQVSFLYFLWFVHQNQSFDNLVNIENGLQEKKLKNGTQPLSYFLQQQIEKKGGKIRLNQKVRDIIQKGNVVQVITTQNVRFQCNYLIMATAPSIYRRINFTPNLCPEKRHLTQKSSMGQLIKVVILYDKQYWKQKGFSGEIITDSFDNPILSSYDDSKTNEKGEVVQPALIVFVGAQVYRYWKEKGNMAFKVCQKIAQAFEMEQLLKPLAVEWYEFDQKTTIGGGPVGVLPPGVLTHIQNIRRTQNRIHFAGTEMATVSIGYMDGAIQSGLRAAKQVLSRMNEEQQMILNNIQKQHFGHPWYNNFVRRTKKCVQWW